MVFVRNKSTHQHGGLRQCVYAVVTLLIIICVAIVSFRRSSAGLRGDVVSVEPSPNQHHPLAVEDTPNAVTVEVTATYHPNPIKRTEAHVNEQLIATLFNDLDPFSGLAHDAQPDWTYPHTNFRTDFFEYIWTKYVKPNHGELKFYVEVGSFKAGSITRLAELLKTKYANWNMTSIVCVDPFSGDVNMWAWNNQKVAGHDFLATGLDGRPRIFDTFMANVLDKGHQDMIVPIVASGLVGMKLLIRLKAENRIQESPGMIYLDSAHEVDETFMELSTAWNLVEECGAILGDDWGWAAVAADVSRFVQEKNLTQLPLYEMDNMAFSQPISGLILGPNGQWFFMKNPNGNCANDKGGKW